MKLEIERKFLVQRDALPPLLRGAHIRQGYISRRPVVRVRQVSTPVAGPSGPTEHWVKTAWLTIKGKGKVSRPEYEYEIPYEDSKDLMTLCEYTIEKVRYLITHVGKVWEVDQFVGPHLGLWLAEIELSSVDEEFQKPVWASTEVSEDPRYTNASLAERGWYP